MASLIKKGVLLNYAAQAPSPSKDYCQLLVTLDQVIFRWWRITLRKDARIGPGEIKDTYEDFLDDDKVQSEIERVFGKNMVIYVKGLCEGHIDYLPRLQPTELLIRVIRYLKLEDIARLAQVSKQFKEICSSDELWSKIYIDHAETPVNEDLELLAEAIGWRKLFFTNKLQLQVQLRRVARQKSAASSRGGGDNDDDDEYLKDDPAFLTEASEISSFVTDTTDLQDRDDIED